jgi:magnesium transporter
MASDPHNTQRTPRTPAGQAAQATLEAIASVPRAVAWTGLRGSRRIQRELRRAGLLGPARHSFRHRHPPGTAPGTLRSHPDAAPPTIRVLGYGPDGVEELAIPDPAGLAGLVGRYPVVWVDVVGVGDAESVDLIGKAFGLHRLALEDVVNIHQRPKVEEYADHLFTVVRMASFGDRIDTEQLSLFLGPGWVVTFQERPGDCWDLVRDRIRQGRGRLRSTGSDFLYYALIDAAVDHTYPILEELGARMELLEEEVIESPRKELVGVIHAARRDLITLRQAVWPMRESVGQLYRDPHPQLGDETRIYFRDCYDHTFQIIDLLENYREMASALMEVYLSALNQRLNEVMKVLTIIATIFIPLTFVAGVYGMNFDPDASPWNMPELGWYWGYPAVMIVMLTIAVGLLAFFKKKEWF